MDSYLVEKHHMGFEKNSMYRYDKLLATSQKEEPPKNKPTTINQIELLKLLQSTKSWTGNVEWTYL